MSFTDRLGMTVPQAILAWSLVLLVGGAAGIVAILLCYVVLALGGVDRVANHGISRRASVRLGGVTLVSYFCLHLLYQWETKVFEPAAQQLTILGVALAFFVIGYIEDLTNSWSARGRFAAMFVVAFLSLALNPELVLQPVGISWLDNYFLSTPLISVITSGLCIAFLPNAFNTADGANGLVASISLALLTGLAGVAPPGLLPFVSAGAVACLLFLIFNLISGRFFLGDGGAYFLGAFCGLAIIEVSNQINVSVWWLLAMIFYPVADLIWSIARRLLRGVSPLKPDNQHFHSLLFTWLESKTQSSQVANTACGMCIAVLFGGLPLALLMGGEVPVESSLWFGVVGVQLVSYVLGWTSLNLRSRPFVSTEAQITGWANDA